MQMLKIDSHHTETARLVRLLPVLLRYAGVPSGLARHADGGPVNATEREFSRATAVGLDRPRRPVARFPGRRDAPSGNFGEGEV